MRLAGNGAWQTPCDYLCERIKHDIIAYDTLLSAENFASFARPATRFSTSLRCAPSHRLRFAQSSAVNTCTKLMTWKFAQPASPIFRCADSSACCPCCPVCACACSTQGPVVQSLRLQLLVRVQSLRLSCLRRPRRLAALESWMRRERLCECVHPGHRSTRLAK